MAFQMDCVMMEEIDHSGDDDAVDTKTWWSSRMSFPFTACGLVFADPTEDDKVIVMEWNGLVTKYRASSVTHIYTWTTHILPTVVAQAAVQNTKCDSAVSVGFN